MDYLSLLAATVGGVLVGLAAAMLIVFDGRIAGISGILSRSLTTQGDERRWRLFFIAGLLLGGILWRWFRPQVFGAVGLDGGLQLAFGGALVGVGTTLSNGCTSGHGLCGIARLSPRSLVATLCFVAAGMVTVAIVRGRVGA